MIQSKLLNFIVILFIGYVFYAVNFQKIVEKVEAEKAAEQTAELTKTLPTKSVSQNIVEEYVQTEVEDIKEGAGAMVECGSNVKLHYQGYLPRNILFEDTTQRDQLESFVVGGGDLFPGLEIGIIGMKAGGVRQLLIPAKHAYDHKNYSHELVAEGTSIGLVVYMLEVGKKAVGEFSCEY